MSTTGSTDTRTRAGSNDEVPGAAVGAVDGDAGAMPDAEGLADVAGVDGCGVPDPRCVPHAVTTTAIATGNRRFSDRMAGS
jgi:hypothetical protein